VADLSLILVTPEKTLLDKPIAAVRVPMFDGSAGVYPGRAPLVGRLGVGELVLTLEDGSRESYFIDSGFIQIKGTQVSVLTSSAQPTNAIDRAAARAELEAAQSEKAITDEEYAKLEHRLQRARKLVNLSGGN